jgi:hypothetical protein
VNDEGSNEGTQPFANLSASEIIQVTSKGLLKRVVVCKYGFPCAIKDSKR